MGRADATDACDILFVGNFSEGKKLRRNAVTLSADAENIFDKRT